MNFIGNTQRDFKYFDWNFYISTFYMCICTFIYSLFVNASFVPSVCLGGGDSVQPVSLS